MLGPIGNAIGGAVGGLLGGGGGGSSGGLAKGLAQVGELQKTFEEQQQIALASQKVSAEGNTALAIAKKQINT